MGGQGYRVGAGEGRGWSARVAVGPPITLYKGRNGGSMGFEKVGPLAQALGFWGGAEEGGKLGAESTVGAPTDMPGGGFEPRTHHAAVY